MKLKQLIPYTIFIIIVSVFYYPFFFKGLVPIPADILPGVYYPWHDISYPDLPAGVPVKNALPSDIVSLTYPLRLLSINLIKSGQWPLWNPQILSGTPLLANFQSAVFNPFNILFLLPIKHYLIWSFQVLLQPFLASLFLFLLLRSFNLSKLSSIYGAFVWGFGGFVAIWVSYNTVIHPILTLPLIIWGIKEINRNKMAGIAISISTYYSLVGGNPPMTVIFFLTAGLYTIWEYRHSFTKYFFVLIFTLLGVGLSSVLLLPGLELMRSSIRGVDTIAFTANIKYLPIFKLITFTAPDLFGNPSTLNLWNGAGLYDNLTVYLGVVPFMLFFSSFFHAFSSNKRKIVHYFWVVFFLSLILMVKNPLSEFIGNMAFMGLSSMVMTRFSVLLGLSVACCSAFVLDEILSSRSKLRYWRATLLLFAGLTILYLLVSQGLIYIVQKQNTLLVFNKNNNLSELIGFSQIAFRNSVIPIILAFIFSALLLVLFYCQSRKAKNINIVINVVVISICLLTFFELFRFYHKYNTFTNPEYLYPQTPITDFIATQSGRFAREIAEVVPSNTWMPYGISSPSGYDTLHSLRYNQYLSLVAGDHLTDTSSRYAEIKKYNNQLFDFLGVTNIIVLKRSLGVPDERGELSFEFQSKDFPKVFEYKKVAIVRNPKAFPLVFSVPSYQYSKSIQQTEDLLLHSDLRHTAIIENDPYLYDLSIAKIENLYILPQEIVFSTVSTSSSFIVTSTTYDLGWNLLIDGKKKDIFITNHAFIGFPIPPGEHKIKLYYYPNSLNTGLMVSLISLLLLWPSLIYLFRWQKTEP